MTRVSLRIPVLAVVLALAACGSADGNGGSSGSGGASGAAGSSGSAGAVVEPSKMVQLPAGFWIDSTEVTRAQYAAWLETNPSAAEQISECAWNTDYTPVCNWPPAEEPNHPVVCVDWCDAYAYCQGVGRRLCGKIGGGPEGIDDYNDAANSQWFYACSSGGLYEYPYGNEYEPAACNMEDSGLEGIGPAGSFPACQSSEPGFDGVFDLCGNVGEWVDACSGSAGPEDACVRHGSSAWSSDVGGRCRLASAWARSERTELVGFRCCSD